ncbi:MAG: tetratricopeptide repeat protein [Candidatus Eisenbacteria bacterium]|nr:tetratricopeptide repeat protein [Candidatus Eisenbacteria bacterium]
MPRSRARIAVLAALLVALAGCAGSGAGGPGAALLRSGDYGRAIEALREADALHPEDPATKRNLGIALWKSGDAAAAVPVLQSARQLDARDVQATYALARAADAAGQIDLALAAYSDYLGQSKKGAAPVRARIEALTLQKAALDVEEAVARERSLSLREVPRNSIAVPDFANVSSSDSLAPLSRGLAQMMITDLNRVRALRVVERQRLQVLLDEIELGQPKTEGKEAALPSIETTEGIKARLKLVPRPSTGAPYFAGAVDDARTDAYTSAVRAFQSDQGLTADGKVGPKTRSALSSAMAVVPRPRPETTPSRGAISKESAPRAGLLIGARRFLQGSFVAMGDTEIQLDAALLETEGGALKATGQPVRGELASVLELEKGLVRQVLQALDITPTPEEWRAIEKLPTDSFLAFLAYSEGLWEEDLGNLPAARAAYGRATRLDPGFVDARDRLRITEVEPGDLGQVDDAQVDEVGAAPSGLTDRLLRTGGYGGIGPGPEIDRDEKDDPSVTDADTGGGGGGGGAVIIIEGDLPTGGRSNGGHR